MNESTSRYGVKLILSYDGKRFAGWQFQPGQRTVQGVLSDAVRSIAPDATEMRAASRTDSGVHARHQVVAFVCGRDIPRRGWIHGLNGCLPDDVSVQDASPCDPSFNPRFAARAKTYHYVIHAGIARDPLVRNHAWHLGPNWFRRSANASRGTDVGDWLNVDAMREAAGQLVGTHDFHAFRAADDPREITTRTIHHIDIVTGYRWNNQLLAIEVRGNSFMRNMVRIMAGTLVEVGRGRMEAHRIPELLGPSASRDACGPTAPAHGLTLAHVELED